MVWAYECMKISMCPPPPHPPPPTRCDHVFFVFLSFGPSVSQYIINGNFQFGKKWHMWCRLLKVHIIPSKSPLHFSEVWITWPPFCINICHNQQFFSKVWALPGLNLYWAEYNVYCSKTKYRAPEEAQTRNHLCGAEHYTTERLSFSKITSIVRTKQIKRLVYTEPFSTPEDSCAFRIKWTCIRSNRAVNLNKSRSGLSYFWIMSNILQGRVSLKSSSLRTNLPEYLINL